MNEAREFFTEKEELSVAKLINNDTPPKGQRALDSRVPGAQGSCPYCPGGMGAAQGQLVPFPKNLVSSTYETFGQQIMGLLQ